MSWLLVFLGMVDQLISVILSLQMIYVRIPPIIKSWMKINFSFENIMIIWLL